VQSLAEAPLREGHVSLAHGFLPPRPTAPALPASHRAWDDAAAMLPSLFFSNRTQRVLGALPVLPAGPEHLPADDLPRAAVVLSALGHAYWRFGADRFFPRRITQVPTALPESILAPWRTVSARLGRHEPDEPFQNFYDLFLANFGCRAGVADGAPRIIENLEVLVPSFQNEAERVFYMSFVEMQYHFTPMVRAVCDLDDAVAADDVDAVCAAFDVVRASFVQATGVWNKIGARRGSAVYCDPILWSKTAAILGVPPEGRVQGATSGACAPHLYVMDAILGRDSYATHYGQFMRDQARYLVADVVRELADRVRAIPLADYLARRADSVDGVRLEAAFRAMVESYVGKEGWLGRHASKVFNYLCVSTITGRNASVSGHERYFARQTWIEASEELHQSRLERAPSGCPYGHGGPAVARPVAAPVRLAPHLPAAEVPTYTLLQVARHYRDDDMWIAIDGLVYNVSPFLAKHPGGMPVLQCYAGQDVTDVFRSKAVHEAKAVPLILQRLAIGRLDTTAIPRAHRPLYDVLYTLLRAFKATAMQFEHRFDGNPVLKLFSDENAHMLLFAENLTSLGLGHGDPAFDELLSASQRMSLAHDFRGPLAPDLEAQILARCAMLLTRDLGMLERMLELAFDAIARVESGAEADALRGLLADLRLELAARCEAPREPSARRPRELAPRAHTG
jgi:hypothetical protein